MAYFNSNELADYIRNVISLEDNTDICCKILQKPQRRNTDNFLFDFTSNVFDVDFENEKENSPNYIPNLNKIFSFDSTLAKINSTLSNELKILQCEKIQNCSNQRVNSQNSIAIKDFFTQKKTENLLSTNKSFSMTSKLLMEKKNLFENSMFDKYAKLEALPNFPNSRTIKIVFPMCETQPCAIPITIHETATLSDLINLSCYIYTREKKLPPCEDPLLYSLYIAEDDYEYDTELPPQDRHRFVSECGFSTLALVKNSIVHKKKFLVKIYFVNNECINFELESLDVLLQTIFDQAIKEKHEKTKTHLKDGLCEFQETDYVLETLQNKNCPLKLSNTIASTGCTDFVLLRKNSFYSNFFNKDVKNNAINTNLNTKKTKIKNGNCELINFQKFFLPNDSNVKIWFKYPVNCFHQFKQKKSAYLIICDNGLEFFFEQKKRWKRLFPTKKNLQIFWNIVGSVEVELCKKNSSQRKIKITYLFIPKNYQFLYMDKLNKNFTDKSNFIKSINILNEAYNFSSWKTIKFEILNEKAWQIATKLLEIIDFKNYYVRQIYQFSSNGKKRPAEAAKLAFSKNNFN